MHPTTIVSLALATLCCVCAEEHHKRAPSGFTGVRGKKSIPDSAYSDNSDNNSETLPELLKSPDASDTNVVQKRAPSGFMGMRGKKPYMYSLPWEGTYPDGLYKRAPSGFMGMRGKKDMETVGYDSYPKRAPSGFMGMRGKKDYDDYYYSDKRAPMGFMGMRGKRFYGTSDEISDDKRAPSGFFGMRGKKQPRQSGFFGMRGKKYPYEFRGKFVGVRGKKLSNEVDGPDYYSDDIARVGEDLDLNQLMLLLTEQNVADDAWNLENSDNFARQQ